MFGRDKIIILVAVFFLAAAAGLFFLHRTVQIKDVAGQGYPGNDVQAITATGSPADNYVQENTSSQATSDISQETSSSTLAAQVAEIQRYVQANQAQREEPLKRADDVKALYMTESVANAPNSPLHKNIVNLLETTEANAVVIDIKEVNGPYLPESLKAVIAQLHSQGIWVIARICAFKDSSLINTDPGWYIKQEVSTTTADGKRATTTVFWVDSSGGYWLDPANKAAQDYVINFAKKAIDFGFDELQFDYIRFPANSNVKNIVYPYYNPATPRYEVMQGFFVNLSQQLRHYKPTIVLSADLFGYVAQQYQSPEIGQRLQDVSGLFDYVSFMLYPSLFYNGFIAPADPARNLPAVNYPYDTTDPTIEVANHPYDVVLRSILSAEDYLKSVNSTTKIRPWLQDFDLSHETKLGIYYNATRVEDEIMAAGDAGADGWMLWSASNVYTAGALKPK